jgi:hypothetical protein
VKSHFVFLYLCCISLFRSQFGLARQLNPWRGACYPMLFSDCLVVVSRVMCVTLMSIWWRASISTRIASMPCWVPRVDLASGVWHLVEKVCCVSFSSVPWLWWERYQDVLKVWFFGSPFPLDLACSCLYWSAFVIFVEKSLL